jgi:RHS repeat-associated protein
VIDHITYDSFGRIVGQTNPIDLRFAYTGREWDGETGQYYYRARYYDPADGRFISEDPIGFNAGDSNLSRYVKNNVINYQDPLGLMLADGGGSFGAGGAGPRVAPPVTPRFNSPVLTPPAPKLPPPTPRVPSPVPAVPPQIRPVVPNYDPIPLYFPETRETRPDPRYKTPDPNNCERPHNCPNPIPTFIETKVNPEHYELVRIAIQQYGKPTILTKADELSTTFNRRYGSQYTHRTNGSATPYGLNILVPSSWDEYPYNSTVESESSIFAAVSSYQNSSAGGYLSDFYRTAGNDGTPLPSGCKFRVELGN